MSDSENSVPFGYCHCGCGEKTEPGKKNCSYYGYVKGQPLKYLAGHNGRTAYRGYTVEDHGFTTACWIWQGTIDHAGYGKIVRDYRGYRAHRWIYEREVGPIPEGLTLDHLCRVRPCVNPDHLEPVSAAENIRRANACVTHCPKGHAYDSENTYMTKSGTRSCRECKRRATREWRRKKRDERKE